MHPRVRWRFAILTYGSLAETQRCLRTLQASMDEPYEVFVVDNGSTDGTKAWLEQQGHGLRWRANDKNRGVPGGRNDLLDFVLPHCQPEDWIVFCDNDLEFTPGWLQAYRSAMQAFPAARLLGQVGHRIVVQDDRRILLPAPSATACVDVLSGGFACTVRADAAAAIGPFDERLGLFWHEDDDYCVRAAGLGLPAVAVPAAGIVHHEHASGVADAGLREGGSLSNQRYLADKWRRAGLVDEGGWVRQAHGYWPPAAREQLRLDCGRATPIGRHEFDAAAQLLDQLVDAPDPARAFAAQRQPLPACWRAYLQRHQQEAAAQGAAALAAQLSRIEAATQRESYAARLRPHVRVPAQQASGPVGHGLCRIADFEDPEWLAAADLLEPGHCMRDPYAQDRVFWESASALLLLRRAGTLRPGQRALVVGAANERLLAQLQDAGVEVVRHDPSQPPPARAFGLVLAVRAASPELLATLRGALAVDGVLVLLDDVALDGAPTRRVMQPMQLVHELGPRHGLAPLWPIRTEVDEGLLEACAAAGGAAANGPRLCALHGGLVTSCVVMLRHCAAPTSGPKDLALPMPVGRRPGRPRIGIDLRTIAYADSAARGIGHYTLRHLQAVVRQAPELDFVCWLPDGTPLPAALHAANVEAAAVDDFAPDAVDLVHLPDPMNLAIGFDSPLRAFRHERTTVTFHDLTPLRHYIEHWPAANREAYLDRIRQLRRLQPHLLCNSRFTAEDAIATLAADPARVTPILAGYNGERSAPDQGACEAVLRRLGLDSPFVLHVGALDPHKNFAASLSAFLQARGRTKLRLVVVGAVDPGIESFAAYCAQKRIPDVVFTGYLPRADLDALYSRALALLFLSKSEGFGFPLLEAMAAGCPVIASGVTSHPEVVGDAGLLVPLEQAAEQAAAALLRLLREPGLATQLRERGIEQAARFSWQDTAERTLAVWRAMLGPRPLPRRAVAPMPLPIG